jgi:hypothetical protein
MYVQSSELFAGTEETERKKNPTQWKKTLGEFFNPTG